MPNDRELLDYGGATDAELREIRSWYAGADVGEADVGEIEARLIREIVRLRRSYARLLSVARGCHDYGGGYGHEPRHAEIYHHGIQTVINALEAAEREPESLQVKVLERVGRSSVEPRYTEYDAMEGQ